ncbi:MAG: TonB-dependent receptor [Saprospiraceae bacterium]|nr:TonB-dependent receptor [Saprospiraceae bacterium]
MRGSWAEVGSDTDPYQLSRRAIVFNGTVSLNSTLPNADLLPETTQSTEVGLDARFFKNNLRLDLSYYKPTHLISCLPYQVPVASGINQRFLNGADIQNQGIEAVVLGFTPISNKTLTWDININFAKNNSKILDLGEGLNELNRGGPRLYQ